MAGLTAFGVSYFIFAVPSPTATVSTIKETDVETVQELEEKLPAKPEKEADKEADEESIKPDKVDDKKSQCGNGTCTPPENADLCPADCE